MSLSLWISWAASEIRLWGSNSTILWIKQFLCWNREKSMSKSSRKCTDYSWSKKIIRWIIRWMLYSFGAESIFQWAALTVKSFFSPKAAANTTHHTAPHPQQQLHCLWPWECAQMASDLKTQSSAHGVTALCQHGAAHARRCSSCTAWQLSDFSWC